RRPARRFRSASRRRSSSGAPSLTMGLPPDRMLRGRTPHRRGGPRMPPPRSAALVFFGATGDLAYKNTFPSLQRLVNDGQTHMPVIGVAKAGWDLDRLLDRARTSLQEHGGVDEAAFKKFAQRLRYIDSDYRDPATFDQIRAALDGARRPLNYLAIPPSMFETV